MTTSRTSNLSPREIAEICEFIEGEAADEVARAMPADLASRYGVAVRRIGSATAVAMLKVDVPMFNHVIGLGVREPVADAMLDAVEELYGGANVRYMVQITPYAATPDLHRRLEARGWPRRDNWAKMIRGNEPPPAIGTDLRIEPIGRDLAQPFAEIACDAFGLPREYAAIATVLVGRPGWHHYLAFDGDRPVSAARLFVRGEIGYLALGATLESHRGRGAQGALMARRILDGLDLGCRWFVAETGEDVPDQPNPSYRNMVRLGFQLAYLRANYIWFPPGHPDAP